MMIEFEVEISKHYLRSSGLSEISRRYGEVNQEFEETDVCATLEM